MKKAISLFMLYLLLTTSALASTFSDNFDNQSYTNSNWFPLDLGYSPAPVWDFVTLSGLDLGYHVDTFSRSQVDSIGHAVNIADNGQAYSTNNLSLQAIFRLDNSGDYSGTAGFSGFYIFSGAPFSSAHIGYAIGIQVDYEEPSIEFDLSFNERILDSDNILFRIYLEGVIDYNIFYNLTVESDSLGFFDIYLNDVDTGQNLATVLNVDPTVRFSAGMIGLGIDAETTINDFQITGNPVPIPGAVWLLGSGLIGLVKFRRKLKK